MLKKGLCLGIALLLLLGIFACAEEDGTALGTMQVVNCEEWVSLRQKASASSERLVKVPLGAYVYNCVAWNAEFIKCEYKNYTGYIMAEYLEKAEAAAPTQMPSATATPGEYETIWYTPAPALTRNISNELSIDYVDMMILGETVLKETFSINDTTYYLYAVRPFSDAQEMMDVAVFDGNLQTIWARSMSESEIGQTNALAVFSGGTKENPCVLLYDSGCGLQCMDIVTGAELWSLKRDVIDLGSGICWAVDTDGTLYIAGYFGPDPVAISARGGILWVSHADDAAIYHPYRILIGKEGIICDYESGPLEGGNLHYRVMYDYYGGKKDIATSAK